MRATRDMPVIARKSARSADDLSASVANRQRSSEIGEGRRQLRRQRCRRADDGSEYQTGDESIFQGRDPLIVPENTTNELKHYNHPSKRGQMG